ncbi:hypothetical protein C0991_011818 [Blastosporella zonata]|nr:hypothetical protein C0991_011818 [Blastosporella zonata]
MSEIYAAIEEEREVRESLGWKEAFFGKGNFIRFLISFVIFFLQQWAGANSIKCDIHPSVTILVYSRPDFSSYYAPQIFAALGYSGQKSSLLASGIYGIVKVVATSIFVFFGVEILGRKIPLFISAMGMGIIFFIIGAILKTHPPPTVIAGQPAPSPPPASKVMAGLLYIYACFWAMGWGRSLEEMDIIFGTVSAEQRKADIERQTRGKPRLPMRNLR